MVRTKFGPRIVVLIHLKVAVGSTECVRVLSKAVPCLDGEKVGMCNGPQEREGNRT